MLGVGEDSRMSARASDTVVTTSSRCSTASPVIDRQGLALGPERLAACDEGYAVEVLRRRRRGRRPFKRAGIPRVVARQRAPPCARYDIPEEKDEARPSMVTAPDGRDEVEVAPAHFRLVGVDPPRHALEAEDVHGEERDVEADEGEPEVPLAERLVHHAGR